ncbi:MAG: NAD-dependent epimerase/dehydratase family protein [Candidatus Shapirobacteria bacterium]|jgi:nucleoside-diphosphate-sugar epimerase
MKMNILVTGSSGFIGQKVCQQLLERGDSVVGVDNMNDYYDVRLKEYRLGLLTKNKNFSFKKIDIENFDDLEGLFRKNQFDGVINLAARAGVRYSMENPFVYMRTNAMGTLNLMELMKVYGVKKMVLASTSSLYAGQPMPFLETLPVNSPISPYAASKKSAEVMAYTYHYLYGLDISIVRYFTVYGPAGRPDMVIFKFIKNIIEGKPIYINGDGTQTRDFTYVDDIAKGTIMALKPLGYEIVNLGGGLASYSLKYLIDLIQRYSDKKAVIEYREFSKADIKDTLANGNKAKKLFGWEPSVDFDQGIKNCVEWYLDNREWANNLSCKDGE